MAKQKFAGFTVKQIEAMRELEGLGGLTPPEEQLLALAEEALEQEPEVLPGNLFERIRLTPEEFGRIPEQLAPQQPTPVSAETVGFIGGGAAGSLGGPGGEIAGSAAGAGLGALVDETIRAINTGEEKTLTESLKNFGLATGAGVVGGAIGAGTGALLSKVKAPFTKRFSPRTKALARQAAEQAGIRFTADELSDSFLVDTVGNIASKSFIGGEDLLVFREVQLEKSVDLFNEIIYGNLKARFEPEAIGAVVKDLLKSQEKVGKPLQKLAARARAEGLTKSSSTFRAALASLFGRVDDAVGRQASIDLVPFLGREGIAPTGRFPKLVAGEPTLTPPPIKPPEFGFRQGTITGKVGKTKEAFRTGGEVLTGGRPTKVGLLEEAEREFFALDPGQRVTKSLREEIPSRITRVFKSLRELGREGRNTTFQALQKQRSRLSELTVDPTLSESEKSLVIRVMNDVEGMMQAAAEAAGPGVFPLYLRANRVASAGFKRFNNDFTRLLARRDPEQVARATFKKGTVTNIRNLRKTVAQDTWEDLQGQFFRQMIEDRNSFDSEGNFIAKKFRNSIRNMTRPTLDAIFPLPADKVALQRAIDIADIIHLKQRTQAAGSGAIFIQLAQAGAALNLITAGPKKGISAAIILGPKGIAKIMKSPRGVKWLTEGMSVRPGTKRANTIISQMAIYLAKEGVLEDFVLPERKPIRRDLKVPFIPLQGPLAPIDLPPPPPVATPTAVFGVRG